MARRSEKVFLVCACSIMTVAVWSIARIAYLSSKMIAAGTGAPLHSIRFSIFTATISATLCISAFGSGLWMVLGRWRSEQRRAMAANIRLSFETERAQATLAMVRTTCHDARTPIQAIMGFTDLVLAGPLDPP